MTCNSLFSPHLPYLHPQTHGSHLRLHQMSVADSGEYVCRANNNIDAQEASIMVSVSPRPSNPSGESDRVKKGALHLHESRGVQELLHVWCLG